MVDQKVGTVAYKLKLPAKSAIYPAFHMFILKKYAGETPQIQNQLPLIDSKDKFRWSLNSFCKRELFKVEASQLSRLL